MVGRVWVRNGGGVSTSLLSQCWDSIWHRPMPACACCHSLCECICVWGPVVFRGPCFLGNLHPFWLLPFYLLLFLPPLLPDFLSPEVTDLMDTFHLGPRDPKSLTVCLTSSYRSLCLFPSAARGGFSDAG